MSEALVESLYFTEYSQDAYLYFDNDLIVRFVNSKAESILGLKRDDLINKKLTEAVAELSDSTIYRNCLECLGQKKFVKTSDYYAPNHSWIEGGLCPVTDGIVFIFHERFDLPEVDSNEKERLRRREAYIKMRDSIVAAVADTQSSLPVILQGCVEAIYKNLDVVLARIWLLNEKENVLDLMGSIGAPPSIDLSKHPVDKYTIGKIAMTKQPLSYAIPNFSEIADLVWAKREGVKSFAGYPLLKGDKLLGVIGIFFRDITSDDFQEILALISELITQGIIKHRTATAFKREQNYFEVVLKSLTSLLCVMDPKGRILQINKACEELFGYRPEEVTGRFVLDMYATPEDYDYLKSAMEKWTSANFPFHRQGNWRAKDGTYHYIDWANNVWLKEDGSIKYIICSGIDLTATKKTEEALLESEQLLKQSQKMDAIGRLAGGVAHDFNNLLTVIIGYSEIALKKADNNSALKKNLEEINKASQRASSLTHQLLAFSRKQVLQTQSINLNRIVRDMETLLKRLIPEDIGFEIELESNLDNILGDQGQIEQVLLNLAVNAKDAMPNGGKIEIRTKNVEIDQQLSAQLGIKEGNGVYLAFCDNGIGMTEEIQERIFEPFFSTKTEGTGLGLATVYGIVLQSGGAIKVSSREKEGSIFHIYFPRTEIVEEASGTTYQIEEDDAQANETILIIEDEEMVRQLVFDTLSIYGYNLLLAENGRQGLDVLEKQQKKIDLILTDIVMPEMTGVKMVERVRQSHPDISVLFMSGYTALENGSYKSILTSENFIPKPFSTTYLVKRVQDILESRRN